MRRFTLVTCCLLVIMLVISSLQASWQGSVAVLIGVIGTAVFLWGTWVIVQITSSGSQNEKPALGKIVTICLALLLKLPLIYAGWLVAQQLGPFGPTWFLVGLGSVYLALVWRAVLAVRA